MVAENECREETRRFFFHFSSEEEGTRELVFASLLENSGMKVA
jgi:hypothetical protein